MLQNMTHQNIDMMSENRILIILLFDIKLVVYKSRLFSRLLTAIVQLLVKLKSLLLLSFYTDNVATPTVLNRE
jgi:hypothetical protein